MKYTRYDYRKKNQKFPIWLLLIGALGIVLGVSIFNLFLIGIKIPVASIETKGSTIETVEEVKMYNINLIQCGLYSKKENADATINAIGQDCNPFIVEEDGKYKVIAGIYQDSSVLEKAQSLNNSSISNFVIKCTLPVDTNENMIKKEILEGYFEVIKKANDKEIKSINLADFKTWAKEISKNNKESDKEIDELLKRIDSLPEEYTNENVKSDYEFLYQIIIKYKQ